jgi:inosose dehydratase
MALTDPTSWVFNTATGRSARARTQLTRSSWGPIWHVHFKDCDPAVIAESRAQEWDGLTSTGHGVFCELGRGCVDFPGVLAALGDIGYDGWIVLEQDILPWPGERPAQPRSLGV